jgi:hypothetical protein
MRNCHATTTPRSQRVAPCAAGSRRRGPRGEAVRPGSRGLARGGDSSLHDVGRAATCRRRDGLVEVELARTSMVVEMAIK